MTDKLKIAVMALKNILEPIKYLQDKAKEDGAKLDGYMAIQLTQNASLYQEIARKALESIDTVVEALEKPFPTNEDVETWNAAIDAAAENAEVEEKLGNPYDINSAYWEVDKKSIYKLKK